MGGWVGGWVSGMNFLCGPSIVKAAHMTPPLFEGGNANRKNNGTQD